MNPMHYRFLLTMLTTLVAMTVTAQKTDSIALGNAVLYYHSYGSGAPIIILSGGPGISAGQESNVAEELGKKYRAILFEQRGTGRSWTKPMDSTTINLQMAINDLDLLRKRLGVTKLNICGHSWGAMLGEAYAAKYPERVNLLLLIGSGEISLTQSPVVDASLRTRIQYSDTTVINYWLDSVNSKREPQKAVIELRKIRLLTRIYDRNQVDRIFPQIEKGVRSQKMSQLMWASLRRERFNLEPTLGAYKGPALIVLGWQDPIGMSTLYPLMRALPQAEVQGINECGHFPDQEQPEIFFGIVNRFLSQHLSTGKIH